MLIYSLIPDAAREISKHAHEVAEVTINVCYHKNLH